MNIDLIIQRELKNKNYITSNDITKKFNVSRQAAHKQLSKLVKEKVLLKIGKTKSAYYIPYTLKSAKKLNQEIKYSGTWIVKNIQEDTMFRFLAHNLQFKKFFNNNTFSIFEYAFTEMLNNVIEHSESKTVNIKIIIKDNHASFQIRDIGIGIFNSMRRKYNLKDDYDCLEFLLKGKKTTKPKYHTGEGIFFTSKIADRFYIESNKIKLIIDNLINDIFVEEVKIKKGTLVFFLIKINSKKRLENLFNNFTNENYKFDKTLVKIKLLTKDVSYISRSQARRLLYGLDGFDRIILDFKGVKSVGQSFVDEVFRVYQNKHSDKNLSPINCNKAVSFMIKRARR